LLLERCDAVKRPPLVPLALVLILVAGGAAVDFQRQRERSVLSGVFDSQPSLLASRTSGRVRHIDCPEGTSVQAGQVLLELEAAPGEADAQALRQAALQARARADEVQAGPRIEDIERQSAVVQELQANYDRTRNGPRPAEIAAARAHYLETQAVYERTHRGARPEEVQRLRAAAQQARARYQENLHGPTREERAQVHQQLAEARAHADYARSEAQRQRTLFQQDATSRQAVDKAETDLDAALATQRAAEQADRQARIGTRSEEIEQARAQWVQAEESLKQAEVGRPEDVAAASADMETARQQYLLLNEGSRAEDLAEARARLDEARAQLTELRHGSRREDLAEARAAAQAADAQARRERETIAERKVEAPRSGVVERVLVAEGDLVAAGSPLVRLSDPTDIWLRVYLPEDELAHVKVGDAAQLAIDGIDGQVAARVDTIDTQGQFTPANLQTPSDRGKQVFGVRLRLAQPDPRVKAGMEATVKQVGSWR
jgi:multidrug resistance efflux pump